MEVQSTSICGLLSDCSSNKPDIKISVGNKTSFHLWPFLTIRLIESNCAISGDIVETFIKSNYNWLIIKWRFQILGSEKGCVSLNVGVISVDATLVSTPTWGVFHTSNTRSLLQTMSSGTVKSVLVPHLGHIGCYIPLSRVEPLFVILLPWLVVVVVIQCEC